MWWWRSMAALRLLRPSSSRVMGMGSPVDMSDGAAASAAMAVGRRPPDCCAAPNRDPLGGRRCAVGVGWR